MGKEKKESERERLKRVFGSSSKNQRAAARPIHAHPHATPKLLSRTKAEEEAEYARQRASLLSLPGQTSATTASTSRSAARTAATATRASSPSASSRPPPASFTSSTAAQRAQRQRAAQQEADVETMRRNLFGLDVASSSSASTAARSTTASRRHGSPAAQHARSSAARRRDANSAPTQARRSAPTAEEAALDRLLADSSSESGQEERRPRARYASSDSDSGPEFGQNRERAEQPGMHAESDDDDLPVAPMASSDEEGEGDSPHGSLAPVAPASSMAGSLSASGSDANASGKHEKKNKSSEAKTQGADQKQQKKQKKMMKRGERKQQKQQKKSAATDGGDPQLPPHLRDLASVDLDSGAVEVDLDIFDDATWDAATSHWKGAGSGTGGHSFATGRSPTGAAVNRPFVAFHAGAGVRAPRSTSVRHAQPAPPSESSDESASLTSESSEDEAPRQPSRLPDDLSFVL
eukprot:CAMPEP_0177636710 /NCGR_PEP_ID=MMETSP0447-20121125/4581_1 /TAXON_ID=0 /ORGANISM="Stygamoeba regulata, Strain BSH-02190019" /LENGTH=464 /DNA_ID=CAMNT_0019138585 /DNA_START=83 /DNA_END=1477 /DNA_ORIENTATION=+